MADQDITTWDCGDESDLTELEDSDDEQDKMVQPPPRAPSPILAPSISSSARSKATRASTQQATDKSRARGGLKNAVPQLKPYRTTNYSAASLFDLIKEQLVELNPEYQRGIVWNDSKQTALIGSIFSNFYVPPIVFTVKHQDDGREIRVCIDGKQRLTSIFRFMLGEIAYKDITSNRKSYFSSPPGAKRKLISDAMRTNFKNKQITCVEYEDLTGEQEREIFQRVQLGVTLAPADRLPAINGPYADLVRNLRTRIETTQGFELYLNWGAARGKDFQALAQIVYLMAHGTNPYKAEPTTMRLEAFLSNSAVDTSSELRALQAASINTMDIFCRISYHKVFGQPIRKHLSPLEFVMASYLVYMHSKKLSDSQLSGAMDQMRKDFARACPDKKYSTKNFKFLLGFVQKEVVKLSLRLKRLPSEQSAFETPVERIVVAKGKRKRVDDEESECSDYVYTKKKSVKPEARPSTTQAEVKPVRKLNDLMKPRSASRAQTVVKRSASANISAIKKNPLDEQVGTPSVPPPTSSRTVSMPSIADMGHPSASASSTRRPPPTRMKLTPTPYAFSGQTDRLSAPSLPRVATPAVYPYVAVPSQAPSRPPPQARQTDTASQEVRHYVTKAPRPLITDDFRASTATTSAEQVLGACREGAPASASTAKSGRASICSSHSTIKQELDTSTSCDKAPEKAPGQASLPTAGGSGTNGDTNSCKTETARGTSERKPLPKFKKTVTEGVDQKSVESAGAASKQQPQHTGRTMNSAEIQTAKFLAIFSSPLVTPNSTPNASPNIPDATNWLLRQLQNNKSVRDAPTRDPRIVAKEAAAEVERQRQIRLQQQPRAAKEQQQTHIPTPPTNTIPPPASARPPPTGPRALRTFASAESLSRTESAVHPPRKRPRSSQYTSGL